MRRADEIAACGKDNPDESVYCPMSEFTMSDPSGTPEFALWGLGVRRCDH